jgi:hypothetical protein
MSTKPHCSYCYKEVESIKKCTECKRPFCSPECQLKDWPKHKQFCCKSGENGTDWEIKQCKDPKKGLGLFALRDFKLGEKIIAERCLLTLDTGKLKEQFESKMNVLTEDEKNAFLSLSSFPKTNSKSLDIFTTNSLANDDQSTLCIHISRANHCCLDNAFHLYDSNSDTFLLLAERPIKKGEEIFISYCRQWAIKSERKVKLKIGYGISCDCVICKDDKDDQLRKKINDLDDSIYNLGVKSSISSKFAKEAINQVEQLLKLYDSYPYGVSPWTKARTYYDGFQICGAHKSMHSLGKQYSKLNYESKKIFGENLKETQKAKGYFDNPKSHPIYSLQSLF